MEGYSRGQAALWAAEERQGSVAALRSSAHYRGKWERGRTARELECMAYTTAKASEQLERLEE